MHSENSTCTPRIFMRRANSRSRPWRRNFAEGAQSSPSAASERPYLKIKAIAVGADLVTTVAGLSIGNCSEAGPLKHVPGLGLAIGVGDAFYTRHISKDSPRFYSMSSDKLIWAPAVTHGAAALHNLAKCVF
jgi:hypothetical protein